MSNKRAFTYSRYSSALQNQQSIERQQENIATFCKRNNYAIIAQYTDEAKSGKTIAGRAGFQTMLNDAREGGCDVIVVEDWKRFGRNMRESLTMFWQMEDVGVEVVSSVGDNHPLMRMFGMYQAQADNEERGRIVRDNMGISVSKGRAMGAPPFGYKKMPIRKDEQGSKTGGNLVIDPTEAEATKALFSLYLSGMGTRRVCAKLNELGLKPRRAGAWQDTQVRLTLLNPVYTGALVWNKKNYQNKKVTQNPPEKWMWVKDQHPAYISLSEWEYINKRLERNAKGLKGRPASSLYLLTRLIICGFCGSFYIHNQRKGYDDVYVCSTVRAGQRADCPHSPRLKAQRTETAVLRVLSHEILSLPTMNAFLKSQSKKDEHKEEKERLEAAIVSAEQSVAHLIHALREMGHSPATAAALKEDEARVESLKADLAALPERKPLTKMQATSIRAECLAALKGGQVGHIRRVMADCELVVEVNDQVVAIKAKHPYIKNNPLTQYWVDIAEVTGK